MQYLIYCFLCLSLVLDPRGVQAQDGTVSGANAGGDVPFELSSGFLIIIEGRIGSLEHLRFALDTGVTTTVVDRKVVKALRLKRHPHQVFNFDHTIELDSAVLPDIHFGPVEATNVPMLIADLPRYSEFAKNVDALIGLDLLRVTHFVVDYTTRKLAFGLSAGASSDTMTNQPPRCMIVTLQVQGHTLHLIVDTGLRDTVLFEDRVLQRLPQLKLQEIKNGISMGERLRGREATLPGVGLGVGDADLRVVLIKGPANNSLPGIDGYLSTTAFKARRIDFDFPALALSWE